MTNPTPKAPHANKGKRNHGGRFTRPKPAAPKADAGKPSAGKKADKKEG